MISTIVHLLEKPRERATLLLAFLLPVALQLILLCLRLDQYADIDINVALAPSWALLTAAGILVPVSLNRLYTDAKFTYTTARSSLLGQLAIDTASVALCAVSLAMIASQQSWAAVFAPLLSLQLLLLAYWLYIHRHTLRLWFQQFDSADVVHSVLTASFQWSVAQPLLLAFSLLLLLNVSTDAGELLPQVNLWYVTFAPIFILGSFVLWVPLSYSVILRRSEHLRTTPAHVFFSTFGWLCILVSAIMLCMHMQDHHSLPYIVSLAPLLALFWSAALYLLAIHICAPSHSATAAVGDRAMYSSASAGAAGEGDYLLSNRPQSSQRQRAVARRAGGINSGKLKSYAYIFKVVLVGDMMVGKSTTLNRLIGRKQPANSKPTIGVEFKSAFMYSDNTEIQLQLWDTGGQSGFKQILRNYFRYSTAAVLMYDVSREETLSHVRTWLKEIRTHAQNENIVLMLLGNKADSMNSSEKASQPFASQPVRQVTFEQGAEFAQLNGIDLFFETSAKTGANVNDAFQQLCDAVVDAISQGVIDTQDKSSGVVLMAR